jgi:hypothetical protein
MVEKNDLATQIQNLSRQTFDTKRGKIKGSTVIACILLQLDDDLEVVAMGSGTKSLGQSSYTNDGYFLKDMHAEVLARRAFQRYLLKDLESKKYLGKDGKLKPGVLVYFYTSRTPCGDASMSDEYWTGAKPFDLEECKTVGVTRMKPSRSDLPDS